MGGLSSKGRAVYALSPTLFDSGGHATVWQNSGIIIFIRPIYRLPAIGTFQVELIIVYSYAFSLQCKPLLFNKALGESPRVPEFCVLLHVIALFG